MVVGEVVHSPFGGDDAHHTPFDIDMLDRRLDEARASEARADRLRAVAELEHAGARLEEEGAQQEEVVPADERDLDVGLSGELSVEMAGGGEAADATAEDEDTSAGHGRARLHMRHHRPPGRSGELRKDVRAAGRRLDPAPRLPCRSPRLAVSVDRALAGQYIAS
jgi:hypothetical protein